MDKRKTNKTCKRSFFEFSSSIRKIIYTTDVIESLNSQFRKFAKIKLIFLNDDSLMKMFYLRTEKVHKEWTRNYLNWDLVINELPIIFENQLKKILKRSLDINNNVSK